MFNLLFVHLDFEYLSRLLLRVTMCPSLFYSSSSTTKLGDNLDIDDIQLLMKQSKSSPQLFFPIFLSFSFKRVVSFPSI